MDTFDDTGLPALLVPHSLRPPRPSLTVVVRATYRLAPGVLEPADPLPFRGDEWLGDEPDSGVGWDADAAPFKVCGEYLVVGDAFAPAPTDMLGVSVRIGELGKSLVVFGRRRWKRGLLGSRPSSAEPFEVAALDHRSSFGGAGFARNPAGLGYGGDELPRIEDPRDLIGVRGDRKEPANTGPISRFWPQRTKFVGRAYGSAWLESRWPYFSEDFDWRYFNAAPADQQLDGYWRGDERIVLEGLHREHPHLECELPSVAVRSVIVERLDDGSSHQHDVPMRLDTLIVDSREAVVVALWRGVVEVAAEDAASVTEWFVTSEPLGRAEAAEAIVARLRAGDAAEAEDEAGAGAAEDAEASAAMTPERFAALVDETEERIFGPMRERLEVALRKAGPSVEAADADRLRALMDPARRRALPTPDPERTAAAVDDAIASLREAADRAASSPDVASDRLAVDPGLWDEMKQGFARTDEIADRTPDAPLDRDAVVARAARTRELRGVDLTGLDLSGLDLRGVDCTQAVFADTRLVGADLEGASLSGAILIACDLTGCSLVGATLRGAFAKKAAFVDADLSDADLCDVVASNARFDGATLTGADLRGTVLDGASLAGARAAGADFRKARCTSAVVDDTSFEGSDLRGASFEKASGAGNFRGADLRDARCADAVLTGSDFSDVRGDGSVWTAARLERATFARASLVGAQFQQAQLAGASFTHGCLKNASLQEADLTAAVLDGADLFRVTLTRARIADADFRGANLYEADFFRARGSSARFDGACLTGTLLAR